MDRRAREKLEAAFSATRVKINHMALIGDNQARMVNICAYTANSIIHVSKLHSEIIGRERLPRPLPGFKPPGFQERDQRIAYRRWLLASNPELCKVAGRDHIGTYTSTTPPTCPS